MRTGQPIIGRPAWYDRNPQSKVLYFAGTIAPHGIAERLTYTCPAGKKAMVELLSARVERITAPTTPDTAMAVWKFTPSGATGNYILRSQVRTAGVNDKEDKAISAALTMFAGDLINSFTFDASTGGTCEYLLTLKITEFDA